MILVLFRAVLASERIEVAPAPSWEHAAAVAIGTPAGRDEQLAALRLTVTAATDDATRTRARAAAVVVSDLAEGVPLSVDSRIDIVEATLLDGPEAGHARLALAREQAANDPATARAEEWVAVLRDHLLATTSTEQVDALLEQTRWVREATPGAAARLDAAGVVMHVVPPGPAERRARVRPLLEAALSPDRGRRHAVTKLMSSIEGDLALVRLEVVTADAVYAAHELSIVEVDWYVCKVNVRAASWTVERPGESSPILHRFTRDGMRWARTADCAQRSMSAWGWGDWTIALAGRPVTNALALADTPLGADLGTCKEGAAPVGVATSHYAYHVTSVPTPPRPSDCWKERDAQTLVDTANAELSRRLAGGAPEDP